MNRRVFQRSILSPLQFVLRKTKTTNVLVRPVKRAVLLDGLYNIVKPPEDLESDVKNACDNAEAAIIELMNVIKKCIDEISQEYRSCIQNQIDITISATANGPFGPHWDNLTQYRVQADDLKRELENYRCLLTNIGQLAQEQSLVSLFVGTKETLELVVEKYSNLAALVQHTFDENAQYEKKLLRVNREHILLTNYCVGSDNKEPL